MAGASGVAALAGAVGLALPILGLMGVLPMTMAAWAVVAMGLGLLVAGGALTFERQQLIRRLPPADEIELGGGMAAEVLGGMVAATLGVLALLGVAPRVSLGAGAMVLGTALMVGSAATNQLDRLGDGDHWMAVPAVATAAAVIGLGAVSLGVLVVAGAPLETRALLLATLLVLGAALAASGAVVGARVSRLRR